MDDGSVRLTQPLVRDRGRLRPASWDEALGRAADGFAKARAAGPNAVGMFSCSKTTNEMNFMAQEIIHSALAAKEFIERATPGFEDYAECVEAYPRERAETETGVPASAIKEVAHAYGRADRAMICWTLGITEHHNAVDNVLALINLALLTGKVGRYGCGLNPLRGQNNVQGGGDMGAIPNRLPGVQALEDAAV